MQVVLPPGGHAGEVAARLTAVQRQRQQVAVGQLRRRGLDGRAGRRERGAGGVDDGRDVAGRRPEAARGAGHAQPAQVAGPVRHLGRRHRHGVPVGAVGPCEHAQRERDVAHRAGHRPDVHEALQRLRPVARDRHPAVRRLQADGAAVARGDADGAADVGAEAERRQPRRERGRLAPGRAAGRAVGVPRVARRPVDPVAGLPPEGELRQVRLAHEDRAGPAQPRHRLGVARRHVVGEEERAARRGQAGDVQRVLGGERHAVQRPHGVAAGQRPLGRARRVLRPLVDGDDGVEGAVQPLGAGPVRRERLDGRDVARADRRRERGRVEARGIAGVHRRSAPRPGVRPRPRRR